MRHRTSSAKSGTVLGSIWTITYQHHTNTTSGSGSKILQIRNFCQWQSSFLQTWKEAHVVQHNINPIRLDDTLAAMEPSSASHVHRLWAGRPGPGRGGQAALDIFFLHSALCWRLFLPCLSWLSCIFSVGNSDGVRPCLVWCSYLALQNEETYTLLARVALITRSFLLMRDLPSVECGRLVSTNACASEKEK
jgi:hypothetical protein